MKYNQMITSLIETDLYKFSQNQLCWHQYPEYTTTWTFRCRNKDVHFTYDMVEEIKAQIAAYCQLRFTDDELYYIGKIRWIKPAYVKHLKLWHPNIEDINIKWTGAEGCGLEITATGTWLDTSMYEIPILAIVNEVYFRMGYNYDSLMKSFKKLADEKVKCLYSGPFVLGSFSEFGLRRRLSGEAQEYIVEILKEFGEYAAAQDCVSRFVGTSNVYLARKYNLMPVGTMAHESLQCVGQGDPSKNPAYSNRFMMESWVKEYGVDNGIMLTDCLTTELFLKDFNKTYATLFSGVRHDSGDPISWGDAIIRHYESMGIDPMTKTLLFSDSLNFTKASEIFRYFRDKAKVAFGIGTYLSNDTEVEPLNIVMKVTRCNGMSVAKLSDNPGKTICTDTEYIEYLKRAIDWRLKHDVN